MKLQMLVVWLWFGIAQCAPHPRVQLIVFSKNRPLQLYAFLESCKKYLTGVDAASVIYCADEPFVSAYKQVRRAFPRVAYHAQAADNPYGDFKRIVCDALAASAATHIIFAVDDMVVIDTVDLHACASALRKYHGYGFYLRLGKDITACYTEKRCTPIPHLKNYKQNIYGWRFGTSDGDWAYPHSVDMTLFHARDVYPAVFGLEYDSPNTFESDWAALVDAHDKRGLCYATSRVVNMPLNLVQEDFLENRHSGECDVHFLLEKFQQGLRMDISVLHQFPHRAPHAEYVPTFIVR